MATYCKHRVRTDAECLRCDFEENGPELLAELIQKTEELDARVEELERRGEVVGLQRYAPDAKDPHKTRGGDA